MPTHLGDRRHWWERLTAKQRSALATEMVHHRWIAMTPKQREDHGRWLVKHRWDQATAQDKKDVGKMLTAARKLKRAQRKKDQSGGQGTVA